MMSFHIILCIYDPLRDMGPPANNQPQPSSQNQPPNQHKNAGNIKLLTPIASLHIWTSPTVTWQIPSTAATALGDPTPHRPDYDPDLCGGVVFEEPGEHGAGQTCTCIYLWWFIVFYCIFIVYLYLWYFWYLLEGWLLVYNMFLCWSFSSSAKQGPCPARKDGMRHIHAVTRDGEARGNQ